MFRLCFALSIVVLCLDPAALFGVDDNNPYEKAALLAAVAALLATRPIRWTNLYIVVAMVVTTWCCALLTTFDAFSWDRYSRGLTSFIIPFLLLCAVPDLKDRTFVLRLLAWGPLAAVALGLVYAGLGISSIWMDDESGLSRLQGSLTTAAFLGGFALTGSYAALQYAARWSPRYLTLVAVNLLICILTASRMATLLAVLLCAFCFVVQYARRLDVIVMVGLATLLAAAAFLGIFGQDIVARLMSSTVSGRDLLWGVVRAYLAEHPFVGVGLGHQILLIPEDVAHDTVTVAAHNEYLRLGVELGYGGAVIVYGLMIALLWRVWTGPEIRRDPTFVAVCAAFFVFCYSDNTFSVPEMFLMLLAAASASERPSPTTEQPALRLPPELVDLKR